MAFERLYIDTPMMARFTGGTAEGRARVISEEPIGRMGRPEEIANAVLWLCSDAAGFVVGERGGVRWRTRGAPAHRRDRALSLRADEVPPRRPCLYTPDFEVQLPDGTIEFHEVKPGYRQKLKDGTRREAPFCFEDAKLKIRIAAAQFDEFGFLIFLIVFPPKGAGWGRVEFGSRPLALSKATCAPQEARCGA